MGVNDLSNEDFERLYGPWVPRTPSDVAALLADYPGIWWIAGGWAIEAFTGVRREHEDTDVSVLRRELPLLRRHLAGRCRFRRLILILATLAGGLIADAG